MIIDVSVTEYRHPVTPREIGLTRDTHTVAMLKRHYVPSWFQAPKRWQWSADLTANPGFQWYVDKYTEFVTEEPWNDVVLFFQRRAVAGRGQIRLGSLYYPGRYPLLNTSAMAGSAEALAGWFCEDQYQWDLIIRPQRISPDMVFHDSNNGRSALVEVKSTSQNKNVQPQLRDDMIKLLKILAATKLLSPRRKYYAVLMMIEVAESTDVKLTSLILEEV